MWSLNFLVHMTQTGFNMSAFHIWRYLYNGFWDHVVSYNVIGCNALIQYTASCISAVVIIFGRVCMISSGKYNTSVP